MEDTILSTRGTGRSEPISLSRLWWAGPVVVATSVIANIAIREFSLEMFNISLSFHHLMWGHFISITIVAVSAAILTFAGVVRYSQNPIRLYRQIAAVALFVSIIPDVAMLYGNEPGHTSAAIFTLITFHIVDAIICVILLPLLTKNKTILGS